MDARGELSELPPARGPITRWLFRRLRGLPVPVDLPSLPRDLLTDDDAQLALYCIYELTYRGFVEIDEAKDLEHDCLVRSLASHLEAGFLAAVRALTHDDGGARVDEVARDRGAAAAVDLLLSRAATPSLSAFVEERGTMQQFCELLVHRSAYQLKEADPHTRGISALPAGARKAAMVDIQFDEYGNGTPGTSHAELFWAALDSAGLNSAYGSHVSRLPAATLATGNLLNMFAAHRCHLGALIGHLALFEMTSVEPMGRYARAAARLGLPPDVVAFFAVHVVADEEHGRLGHDVLLGPTVGHATRDGLDPADLAFGAHALLLVEAMFAGHVLRSWNAGVPSLRSEPPAQGGWRPWWPSA